MPACDHFRLRVRERIGPHVDADALADLIETAILAGDETVCRFRCRSAGKGRRHVYRVTFGDEDYFAVASPVTGVAITVLDAIGTVRTKNKGARQIRYLCASLAKHRSRRSN